MEEKIINYELTKQKVKTMKLIISLYLLFAVGLGVQYAILSKGGNILTILEFIKGSKELYVEALIYESISSLIFIMISVSGCGLALLFLHLTDKIKFIPYLYSLLFINYVINKILLYQAVVHLSTSGAIRNTEMWDFKMMFESGLLSGKSLYISLVLFSGIIVVSFLTSFLSGSHKGRKTIAKGI